MSDFALDRANSSKSLWSKLTSNLVGWVGQRSVGRIKHGHLKIILPSGKSISLGDRSNKGPQATLKLNNFNVLRESARRGTVGFAAAYMSEDIEVDDLVKLFSFFLLNREQLVGSKPNFFQRAAHDMAYHLSRQNTKEGSKKNISEHYDLGNDFYSLWLDPSMAYSSAYYTDENQTLTDAQWAKNRLVAEMAGIKNGATVLEIGCGWGALAETVAKDFHAKLKGITLSIEQLKYAKERMQSKGLSDLTELVIEDYRDTENQFDHVCSVEMIEAVGEDHWPIYFKTVHDRLKSGGTATIQAITINEIDFEHYRKHVDFIQRYIFPGGMLLTETAMQEQGDAVGLTLEKQVLFGQSYAKTLRIWRENFLQAWPEIEKLGFDDVFKRKWVYYLCYCEAGFAENMIDVGVYQYRRND
ncbi:class I SAM-dependent methyltransferase [Maritalea sp.]|jgi:cyclopropane-fatty-acyl-phospholipid synthase|uniref:class I SAM-dependent methyltransferase n=1 Tax=Maritalea sp. TaxID=2003361 RepID=UPI0039E382CC